MAKGKAPLEPSTKHRVALLGPPKSIHEFRERHTDREGGKFQGILGKVERTRGETLKLYTHLKKDFTHRDLADPFVRRMIYLEASMAAHNLVLDGTVKEHNYGKDYTKLLDNFVVRFVPAERQEAVWRLIRADHKGALKKPTTKFVGPPEVLDKFRKSRPEMIEHDRQNPEEYKRLMDKSGEVVTMPEFTKEEKLCVAYDSASRAADMQAAIAEKRGQRFNWGEAYTNNMLEILDAAPPEEKYVLLKRAFDDHLKERKAHLEGLKK